MYDDPFFGDDPNGSPIVNATYTIFLKKDPPSWPIPINWPGYGWPTQLVAYNTSVPDNTSDPYILYNFTGNCSNWIDKK